jgi:hypothetical protein
MKKLKNPRVLPSTVNLGRDGVELLIERGIKVGTNPDTVAIKTDSAPRRKKIDELRYFALVYAMYAAVSVRKNYPDLVIQCADKQDMKSSTNGAIETAVLRCILGLKRGSQQTRNRERTYVAKRARAIKNLMGRGTLPSDVYSKPPGPNNSVDAFSKWHRAQNGGDQLSAQQRKNRTIRGLPEMVGEPGQLWQLTVRKEKDGSLRCQKSIKIAKPGLQSPYRVKLAKLKDPRRKWQHKGL